MTNLEILEILDPTTLVNTDTANQTISYIDRPYPQGKFFYYIYKYKLVVAKK